MLKARRRYRHSFARCKLAMKISINKLKLTGVFGVITLALLALIGCEPGGDITFENEFNQNLTISYTHARSNGSIDGFVTLASVAANSSKVVPLTFLGPAWVNRINVSDNSGKVIFTHDYTMGDLDKVDWKIVIPP